MKNLILLAAILWSFSPIMIGAAYAQDNHAHEETHEQHDEAEGHAHDDGHEKHNDHGEKTDDHDEHGHDEHKAEDAHDDHGHGGHGDEHGEHEEGKTEIGPDAAKNAGVVTSQAGAATIAQTVPLTGRITVNQNAKANVRARFPGIIRSVKVNLGETVEKGQILAVVESNESLQDYNVVAPINGVVLERNTNLGDVANGEPICDCRFVGSVGEVSCVPERCGHC